jgi:hypothetical protein
MNLRRGLFRLWLMLSGVWLTYSIWQYLTKCTMDDKGLVWCKVQMPLLIGYNIPGLTDLENIAAGILGPPVGMMILGLISLWVAKGFAEPSKSN